MVANHPKIIKALIRLRRDYLRAGFKLPKGFLGEIGELYVLWELNKRGFRTERKGGQGGYDIYLKDLDKRVEVKTSLLKNDTYSDKRVLFWGWTIKKRRQKKADNFDYLTCVALERDLLKPRFYIFTHKEAFSVPDVKLKRFSGIQKAIQLFKDKKAYERALKCDRKIALSLGRLMNKSPSRFLNRWAKLKNSVSSRGYLSV